MSKRAPPFSFKRTSNNYIKTIPLIVQLPWIFSYVNPQKSSPKKKHLTSENETSRGYLRQRCPLRIIKKPLSSFSGKEKGRERERAIGEEGTKSRKYTLTKPIRPTQFTQPRLYENFVLQTTFWPIDFVAFHALFSGGGGLSSHHHPFLL